MSGVYIQTPELFHVKPEQKALSTMHVINLMLFPILSKKAHQILAGSNSFTLVPAVVSDNLLRIKKRL